MTGTTDHPRRASHTYLLTGEPLLAGRRQQQQLQCSTETDGDAVESMHTALQCRCPHTHNRFSYETVSVSNSRPFQRPHNCMAQATATTAVVRVPSIGHSNRKLLPLQHVGYNPCQSGPFKMCIFETVSVFLQRSGRVMNRCAISRPDFGRPCHKWICSSAGKHNTPQHRTVCCRRLSDSRR